MNTKCVVSFAKKFFFFFWLPHISYEERRYHDKFYLFSMANLWRKWKSYSEISFHNDYHFFFSLKSTQQKFKELLSQHCQLHCRKKNAAELSWWWLNQTIIILCIKPGTIGDNFTPGRTLSYVGWRTSLWFVAGCCFIQIRYLRLSPTNLKTFLPFFSQ